MSEVDTEEKESPKGSSCLKSIILAIVIFISFVGISFLISSINSRCSDNSNYQDSPVIGTIAPETKIDSIALKRTELEKNYEQLKRKQLLEKTSKKLRQKYDDIQAITYFYDKTTPISNRCNNIHLYFGKDNNDAVGLRLRIRYTGSNWLFIDSYTIKTDDDVFEINTSYGNVKRDNGYSGIWEWYDTVVDANTLLIIQAIISSKTVKIRYIGQQYHYDRIVSNSEKIALKNVLDAYYGHGGKID